MPRVKEYKTMKAWIEDYPRFIKADYIRRMNEIRRALLISARIPAKPRQSYV